MVIFNREMTMAVDDFGHRYVIGVQVSQLEAAAHLQRAMTVARKAAQAEQSAAGALAALEDWASRMEESAKSVGKQTVSAEPPATVSSEEDSIVDAVVIPEPTQPKSVKYVIAFFPLVAGVLFGSISAAATATTFPVIATALLAVGAAEIALQVSKKCEWRAFDEGSRHAQAEIPRELRAIAHERTRVRDLDGPSALRGPAFEAWIDIRAASASTVRAIGEAAALEASVEILQAFPGVKRELLSAADAEKYDAGAHLIAAFRWRHDIGDDEGGIFCNPQAHPQLAAELRKAKFDLSCYQNALGVPPPEITPGPRRDFTALEGP